jgi:hypothetical protein
MDGFKTVYVEHEGCAGCVAAVEAAAVMARVTGSVGATHVEDGSRLREPYHHEAKVARMTPAERIAAAGISRPGNWDDMGSSARDLWEERMCRSLDRQSDHYGSMLGMVGERATVHEYEAERGVWGDSGPCAVCGRSRRGGLHG